MGSGLVDPDAAMTRHIAWCLLPLLAVACHDPDDYLLAPSRADAVLSVGLSATTMPADGVSRVTLSIQIDPRADADKRNVTVTTTAGVLIAGGREAPSVTVSADQTGKAVVELRSSTTPATAQLEITVASVSRTAAVTFARLSRDQVFDASVSRTSLPADGFSTATITATLRQRAFVQQPNVTFETSAGTLIAAGRVNSRVIVIPADVNGIATVSLQSDRTVGTAQVRVTALEVAENFDIAFTPVDPLQIIAVSVAPGSIPADGVTSLVVSAAVAANLPAGRRTVVFRTTIGQLLPSVVEAGGSNVARASLMSNVTGVARITATVDGTTGETTAQFTHALPDRVHVTADAAELKTGGSATIRTTLLRSTGSVSPQLPVSVLGDDGRGCSHRVVQPDHARRERGLDRDLQRGHDQLPRLHHDQGVG